MKKEIGERLETKTHEYAFSRRWLKNKGVSSGNLGVIDAIGNSMEPRLREGDFILVDRGGADPLINAKMYVLRIGNELLVKNIQRLPGGRLEASSSNPDYKPFMLEPDYEGQDIAIVGRVVASMGEW